MPEFAWLKLKVRGYKGAVIKYDWEGVEGN